MDRKIYTEQEQRLVANGGDWNFGILRHLTLYPEVLVCYESGDLLKIPQNKYVIPTLIYGRSCDSTDLLNPKVNNDWLRIMLPDLSKYKDEMVVLRLGLSAYMDNSGDFNWQSAKIFPVYHTVCPPDNLEARFPRKYLSTLQCVKSTHEYRIRNLARQSLTSIQIQQAKQLVADQFSEREQMTSWLRYNTHYGADLDRQMLDLLFYELVEECIDSGLSMVSLKVPHDKLDAEGEVVAVNCVKILHQSDIPEVPLSVGANWERRATRPIFETEALILRQLSKMVAGFKESLFPMAYGAMGAKRKGESSYTELMTHSLNLASATNNIKSIVLLATGAMSLS